MTDDELIAKIEELTANYSGRADSFYEAVGMVVVGRLLGWRAMRLISSRKCWMLASSLFGDLKHVLPERGNYARKSVGLSLIDTVSEYWDIIDGKARALPLFDRKRLQ